MLCNTSTCTGYSADILGFGTMQNQVKNFWIKSSGGTPLTWPVFSEDSQHVAGTTWIGVELKNGVASDTGVAYLRIFDCNNNLTETRLLIIPTGMTWAKWTFTCSFGQSCHFALTRQSWGTGSMPEAPPPL